MRRLFTLGFAVLLLFGSVSAVDAAPIVASVEVVQDDGSGMRTPPSGDDSALVAR